MNLELLDAYHFELPEHLIAQEPGERGASRLLVLDRHTGERQHRFFRELPELVPEGALLVANNSRVVPVRLMGQRPTGGKSECFILSPVPLLIREAAESGAGCWSVNAQVLLRPSKNMPVGSTAVFGPDGQLSVTVLHKGEFGHHEVRMAWEGGASTLLDLCNQFGHMPLPPYIRRGDTDEDRTRYQTIYSSEQKSGSAAAPTAGLHFTPEICAEMARRGVLWSEVTLHVGYGTFSPVRERVLDDHKMHAEYVECSAATAAMICEAKAEGRPVIAVGTTSCRTLEGIAAQRGRVEAFSGFTDIFIRPGYNFKVVDGMVTNFHLPESTLLMLVSALAGYEQVRGAYAEAVEEAYRFFSYGDAMFVR